MMRSRRFLVISTIVLLACSVWGEEEQTGADTEKGETPSLNEELLTILHRHAASAKPFILGQPTQLLMDLHSFVSSGPETSIVYTTEVLNDEEWKRLCETNAPGKIPIRSKRVVKQRFSAAEVDKGKARNKEAKRCVVQLLIDGLQNLDDTAASSVLTICAEILDSSQKPIHETEDLEFKQKVNNAAILLAEDETRPLEIRLLAMTHIDDRLLDKKQLLLNSIENELVSEKGTMSWSGNREEMHRRILGIREKLALSSPSLSDDGDIFSPECRDSTYFNLVSSPAFVQELILTKPIDNDATRIALYTILSERSKMPDVFTDFWRYLSWVRTRFDPDTGTHASRPGAFEGHIRWFLFMGPEKERWSSNDLDDSGGMVRKQTDHIFTEGEIENGNRRNRAARMALLETILKGMDELGGYEQSEIINVAKDIWIRSPQPKDEDVDVSAVLDALMKSGYLHPIARLQLGRDKYSANQLRVIYKSLLDDGRSPFENFYSRYVQEAVKFLKENHPEELEKVETALPWKKEIIDKALGRPVTPWWRDEADQGSANEVEVIL